MDTLWWLFVVCWFGVVVVGCGYCSWFGGGCLFVGLVLAMVCCLFVVVVRLGVWVVLWWGLVLRVLGVGFVFVLVDVSMLFCLVVY